jgi:two-component system, chemotaxis family, chemotaxis protein CheY
MRALVVDDCRATRRMLGLVLSDLGIEHLEATDGLNALEQLEKHESIDVVFADWNMPGLNGLEFVRRVRANARFDGLRILMVSVNTDTADLATALEAGVDDYLMKPFDKQMVASKLQLMGSLA